MPLPRPPPRVGAKRRLGEENSNPNMASSSYGKPAMDEGPAGLRSRQRMGAPAPAGIGISAGGRPPRNPNGSNMHPGEMQNMNFGQEVPLHPEFHEEEVPARLKDVNDEIAALDRDLASAEAREQEFLNLLEQSKHRQLDMIEKRNQAEKLREQRVYEAEQQRHQAQQELAEALEEVLLNFDFF